MKYRVLIQQDEDGVFVAEVAGLPGCISQGQTRSEALVNVQEALEAYLRVCERTVSHCHLPADAPTIT